MDPDVSRNDRSDTSGIERNGYTLIENIDLFLLLLLLPRILPTIFSSFIFPSPFFPPPPPPFPEKENTALTAVIVSLSGRH